MTTHLEHLLSLFDPSDKDVLDVGAGTGAFAHELAQLGGRVVGVEIEPKKVEAARELYGETIQMLEGRGEALPSNDESQDLVCLMFSLHHIPLEQQPDALREIHRVLRPGGRLHVVDPRPYGSMTEVVKLLDDETHVRTQSQNRMEALSAEDGFERLSCEEYVLDRQFADFEALMEHVSRSDPSRTERLPAVKSQMRSKFDQLGKRAGGGVVLGQPCVAYHFRKTHPPRDVQ